MIIDMDSFIVFIEGIEVYVLNLVYFKGLEKGCCLFRMFFLDLEIILKKFY